MSEPTDPREQAASPCRGRPASGPADGRGDAHLFGEADDGELVRRANRGETEAFERIVGRHAGWALGLARRLLGEADLAEDLVQEAFHALFSRFPGFRLTAPSLRAYLYPVLVNLARRAARRRDAGTLPATDAAAPEPPAAEAPPAPAERAEHLAALLGALAPAQRETVLLRHLHGLSLEEIAAALEIPTGTVKSRLHAAHAALRAHPHTRDLLP